MRILLTNDDGIHAPGIHALWHALEDVAELYMVAPEGERSATGHGITVHMPIRVEKLLFQNPKLHGWAVSGTPTDCVKAAIEILMQEPPDLVISGINRGPNLGTDVLYSGTVSAAMEGVIYGVPAIACSVAGHPVEDYTYAAEFIKDLCLHLTEQSIPKDTLLNVNIPAIPREEIKGYRVTKLGSRRYQNIFEERVDPRGRTYYWLGGEVLDLDAGPQTDLNAVQEGYVSITPIHFDLTDYPTMNKVRGWLEGWEHIK